MTCCRRCPSGSTPCRRSPEVNDSDYARRRESYEKALAPLGITLLMEPIGGTGGFGRDLQALLLDNG
jgi:hypothetical protein